MPEIERRSNADLRQIPSVNTAFALLWELAGGAYSSSVSGLLNKAAFEQFDRSAVGGGPWTVVFTDLTGFKRVNDEFGHAMGDALLGEAGRLLQQFARTHEGRAFHLSGDEFALVFSGDSTELVVGLAINLRSVAVNDDEGRSPSTGLAYGFSVGGADDLLGTLLKQAEQASGLAKSNGDGVPIRWSSAIATDELADPRKKCRQCGATTKLQVPKAKLRPGAPVNCANCGDPFDG